jgi:hypothetical protein
MRVMARHRLLGVAAYRSGGNQQGINYQSIQK